jgi:hypothetical protein
MSCSAAKVKGGRCPVRQALAVLFQPGQVVELRIPNYPRSGITASGYFDDHDKAAAAAMKYSGKAAGVYVTLNRINPGLLARVCNRVEEYAKQTTGDNDVLRRAWLPLDFDPARPAGIPSTDAEHEAALSRAAECRGWLSSMGWPLPVEADSGNGAHLLYRIDLANNEGAKDLVERCLQAVAWRWSDRLVDVDLKVFNAARVWKLYGTKSAKGDGTDDRPHRPSRILRTSDLVVPVPVDLLEALAELGPPEEPKAAPKAGQKGRFDVAAWLKAHGLGVAKEGPWNGGYRWVLADCPWDDSHQNQSAYVVQFASGPVAAGCQHNSCRGNNWHALRDLQEPSWRGRHTRNGERGGSWPSAGATAGAGAEEDWPEPIPLLGPTARVPTFPTELLPAWQRDWVLATAEATQTPPDLPGMLSMAVAGAALAGKFRLEVRPGWVEPLNVFAVVALPPGERKTAVFKEALKPVVTYEAEERARMALEIAGAESERRMLDRQLKRAEERAAGAADPADRARLRAEAVALAAELAGHEVPAAPQLWADDATPEALATLLSQQGGRLLVASAEGTPFEIAKGRYSEAANFEVWLKGHAGDALRVARVGRPPELVELPALSAALAVQPHVISGLAEQASMKHRGYLARWLYSLPASRVGSRLVAAAAVPGPVAQDYHSNMLALWRTLGGVGEGGRPAPYWLKFSAGADQALRELAQWLEPQLGEGQGLSWLAGWANKLAGAAARIAAGWHVALAVAGSGRRDAPVAESTVRAAVQLAREYLLPHAQAAFGLMGCDQRVQDARHILRWLRAHSGDFEDFGSRGARLSRRDIYQGCKGRWPTVAELEPGLALLEKHLYLRALPPEARSGPGRPSAEYLVNPRCLTSPDSDPYSQNPQNPQNPSEEGAL